MDRVRSGFATFNPGLLLSMGMEGEAEWSGGDQLVPCHRHTDPSEDKVGSICIKRKTEAERFAKEMVVDRGHSEDQLRSNPMRWHLERWRNC